MSVSIVIPAYNEEKAIGKVLSQVSSIKIRKEVIVVDDGSTDRTSEMARKAGGSRLIRHDVNMGKANALRTGIKNASYDKIVTLDADCTYPVELVPELIKELENGADLVIGSRFSGMEREMPALNSFGNKLFTFIIMLLTRRRVSDSSSGMRAFRKGLWDTLGIKARNLEGEVEMTTRSLRKGLKVSEVPIPYMERVGDSKLSPSKDGFRFLMSILRAGFF